VPLVLPVESAAPAAQVDYAELRRLVREELDRSASGPWTATPPGSARPAPATPEPPTPEQQASLREATAVVDRAVAARRWTADDRRAWWDLTHRRPSLELFELQRKLMVAMNRGEIAPERGVPPFSPPTPPFPNR
jgi:hypothetical protein